MRTPAAEVAGASAAAGRDADGTAYLPMLAHPVIVLIGDQAAMDRSLRRARDRSLATAVYIEDMFATSNDEDNRATVRAVTAGDLRPVGIAVTVSGATSTAPSTSYVPTPDVRRAVSVHPEPGRFGDGRRHRRRRGGGVARETDGRDRYPDALRAGALLVVVFGHWIATLPRLEDGRMVSTEHLLTVWDGAGTLTWVLQVVPLFVLVSAAVSADGVARRLEEQADQRTWWAGRALGLARPTVTYLAVLAVLALIATRTGGRLLGPLDQSLTVHLWFLVMLLAVQALLPLSVRADDRFGLRAVGGLLLVAVVVDLTRGGVSSLGDLRELGSLVTGTGGGIGWVNALVIWLLPQQLGIAWKRGRFGGLRTGLVLFVGGLAWLAAGVATGYPVAVVGGELDGSSNVLPPTLALVGVMWVQTGAVLVFEGPARRALAIRPVGKVVVVLGALGMPLYLWHKLAELPAAWLGERLGAPIDAGVPGEAGFWSGRLVWVLLCLVAVTPVMAAVIAFETRRRAKVPQTTSAPLTYLGGAALLLGIVVAMGLGAHPGSYIAVVLVGAASLLLRARRAEGPDGGDRPADVDEVESPGADTRERNPAREVGDQH